MQTNLHAAVATGPWELVVKFSPDPTAILLHVNKLRAEDCLPPFLLGYLMSPRLDPARLDSDT